MYDVVTRFTLGNGLAPRDGFEPPAKRLTVACSTAELPGNNLKARLYITTIDMQACFLTNLI